MEPVPDHDSRAVPGDGDHEEVVLTDSRRRTSDEWCCEQLVDLLGLRLMKKGIPVVVGG
jgi:hypothetical protein